MLTVTETDMPQITFATPEDVREASRKAMHFWVGALSPLWAPFWAASTVGVGVWALGQGLTRTGMNAFDKDMPLALKWPGFMTPWNPAIGKVVEQIDAVADATRDTLAEPMQLAFEAGEKLETAVTEAIDDAKAAFTDVTDSIEDAPKTFVAETEALADKAEEVIQDSATTVEATADEVVLKTEQATDTTQEAITAVAETAEKVADEAVEETEKTVKSVKASPMPLLDPVAEVPVVPAVAEATAKLEAMGKLEAPTPRRPKKR